MYDVAFYHGQRVEAETGLLARLGLSAEGYVLATVHRAENTDHSDRLGAIVDALIETAKKCLWFGHCIPEPRLSCSRWANSMGWLQKCTSLSR